jgi:integrase
VSSVYVKVKDERYLYQHPSTGIYYLRKQNQGEKDTNVSLGTTAIKEARALRDDYLAVRRARKLGFAAPEPKPEQEQIKEEEEKKPARVKCKTVFDRYVENKYPDQDGEPHVGDHLRAIKDNLEDLRVMFDEVFVDELDQDRLDAYRDWRKGNVKKVRGGEGARTVDKELTTFSKALSWSVRKKVITSNPIKERAKYCKAKNVLHCRDLRPDTVDELHEIAEKLFEVPQSEVLGWQALFEGMTGLRTCEILNWKITRRGDIPGGLTQDRGSLCVRRAKKGSTSIDNPYLPVDQFLKEALDAHAKWRKKRYPNSKWFFPGTRSKKGRGNAGKKPVAKGALTAALNRLWADHKIKKHMTSHGLRALYVWVRRSQGADDSQIAFEIGHSSPLMIQRVYGSCPPHWRTGKAPNYSWRPAGKLAWSQLDLD